MRRNRDRVIAITAAVVLVVLAGVVVALVLGAQDAGINTREDLRLEQARALAGSMDTRVQQAFTGIGSTYGAPGAWKMAIGDPTDATKLQPQDPDANTGTLLVSADGTLVNGSLLRDPTLIGKKYTRDGLDEVLAGDAALLPAGPGLTTSRPTIALAVPVRDAAGTVVGAAIIEIEIAPDSFFNQEVSQLRAGRTGDFSYVDRNGVVIASSNEALLGKPLTDEVTRRFPVGFHRGGGKVAAIADVPQADWKLVFEQTKGEFQGDLTGPLQTALLLFLAAVAIGGVIAVLALLRRLQAAREEQRRLREIGDAREEFTSIVSHELRTPVAGLLGFLQTTTDHWSTMSEDERRRAVERAYSNARSLQTLTSDVLDSASIEANTLAYRFETIDLRASVDDAVEMIRDADPDRPMQVDRPGDPVLVRADAIRVRQVLANLLDNAAKSSAPDAPIDVAVEVNGKLATVSVRDRGPGILPDERERIFDKFTRGRSGVGRGTGLGLYISRHIVEAHGGTITADDLDGEAGARISFSLPLA